MNTSTSQDDNKKPELVNCGTAFDVLKAIDDWAEMNKMQADKNGEYIEIDALWSILTALRGPDDDDDDVKDATTALIRGRALPNLSRLCKAIVKKDDCTSYAKTRKMLEPSHFYNHVIRAFWVLGLKMDEVND